MKLNLRQIEVDITIRFGTVFYAVFVNIAHNPFQFFVYLLSTPAVTFRVLRHFQPRDRYSACVGCFTRCIEDLVFLEDLDRLRCTGHIGPFRDGKDPVLYKRLGIIPVNFVLCGRRQRYIGFLTPRTGTLQPNSSAYSRIRPR